MVSTHLKNISQNGFPQVGLKRNHHLGGRGPKASTVDLPTRQHVLGVGMGRGDVFGTWRSEHEHVGQNIEHNTGAKRPEANKTWE